MSGTDDHSGPAPAGPGGTGDRREASGASHGPGGSGEAWIDSPPPPPLGGSPAASGAGGGGTAPAPRSDAQRQLRRGLLIGAGSMLGVGLVVGVVALAWLRGGGSDDATSDEGSQAATTSATPTPSPTTDDVTVVERAVPATQIWTPTGVRCDQGDTLRIDMYGSASHDQSPAGTVGPTGLLDPAFHQFNVDGFPDANTMAVIASLGDDRSTYFVVGSGANYVCPVAGELRLGVNDEGVWNNSGAFVATITHTAVG